MPRITLWDNDSRSGASLVLESEVRNLKDLGFNDRTGEIEVQESTWLLYTDADYQGRCFPFRAGSGSNFAGTLDNAVSSLRPLPSGSPLIVLFRDSGFCGPWRVVTGSVDSLSAVGFNDAASSAIVVGGTWRLFVDANFRGASVELTQTGGPRGDGFYPDPASLRIGNDALTSLRPVVAAS